MKLLVNTQAVIIGEELARDSILSVVDFFTRDPKRRLSVYFPCGKVKDILKPTRKCRIKLHGNSRIN